MELTGNTLRQVTFQENFRGYDRTEVGDFINAVADGIDQLNDLLKKTMERATRAEQQVAQLQHAGPMPEASVAPSPASPSSNELGRVWERAVAAAEHAIADAQREAEELLSTAQSEAETHRNEASAYAEETRGSADEYAGVTRSSADEYADGVRGEAERYLNEARDNADQEAAATVENARAEATRISEEAQSKLRQDIEQLETWRAHLRTDVDGLVDYLDAEKARLRTHIQNALSALDEYGSKESALQALADNGSTAGSVAAAYVSPTPPPTAEPKGWESDPVVSTSSDERASWETPREPAAWSVPQQEWQLQPEEDFVTSETPVVEESIVTEAPKADSGEEQGEAPASPWGNWTQPGESSDESSSSNAWSSSWQNPQQEEAPSWANSSWAAPADDNKSGGDEDDPFLAELRRAVQEEEPLGPRGGEGSIDSLYADENGNEEGGDKGGFFRRKK